MIAVRASAVKEISEEVKSISTIDKNGFNLADMSTPGFPSTTWVNPAGSNENAYVRLQREPAKRNP